MWKYIKVSLVLFLTAVICALGVAGVNYLTSPKIEEYKTEQKLKAYKEIFADMDASKSEIISDGFKSGYIKEKVVVRSADKDLGYAFNASGKNTYGPIALVVGFDPEGNLLDIVIIENGQTGGRGEMIKNWVESTFVSGMTPTQIDKAPIHAGATIGSNLVKSLLNACLAELGIKTEIQEKLEKYFGEVVDMSKSKTDDLVHYANQLALSYVVKNAKGETLGYYFEYIKGEEVVEIALDSNYQALENVTATELELEVAVSEVKNEFKEDLALKVMFGDNLTVTEKEEFATPNDSKVIKYSSVARENESLGSFVVIERKNTYGLIQLLVGINADNTLNSLFIVDATQTEGKNLQLSQFVSKFTNGMSGLESIDVEAISGATFAANTVKDIIADAFEIITGTRPSKGYDEQYKTLFENVDLSKSTDYDLTDKPNKDSFLEAKELKDAKGNLLGYGFILAGDVPEWAGASVKIMVGVQTDGKLKDVIMLEDHSTSGSVSEDYMNKFIAGMTQNDVTALPDTGAGASYTFKKVKELVKFALMVVSSPYETFYIDGFEGISIDNSEISSTVSHKEVLEKIVAKDANGQVLGYGFVISTSNVYGYNIFLVTLDASGNFKGILDIENNHSNLDESMAKPEFSTLFPAGLTYDQIKDLEVGAGSTYTKEVVKLGILIAMEEHLGSTSEILENELLIKELFDNAVMAHTNINTLITNKAFIKKAFTVGGSANYQDGVVIGYLYVLSIENRDVVIDLAIAINADKTYRSAKILNWTQKDNQLNDNIIPGVPTPSFSDTLRGNIEKYLNTFVNGMTLQQVKLHANLDRAYFTSETIKSAIKLAISEANGQTYNYDINTSYNYDQVYMSYIEGIDLRNSEEVLLESNRPEILSGIKLINKNKELFGYAYIVENINVYSHNYILVVLNKDGNVVRVVDVENNHGSLNSIEGYINNGILDKDKNGLTFEEVANLSYNIHDWDSSLGADAHASFTIEQTKIALMMVLENHSQKYNDSLIYELGVKDIYPFTVYGRDKDIISNVVDKDITFAHEVYGYRAYADNQKLGFAFAIKNETEGLMIGVNNKGLFTGYSVLVKEFYSAEELSFLSKIEANASIDKVKAMEETAATKEIKALVVKLMTEGLNFADKTEYDGFIKQVFSEYFPYNSLLIEEFKSHKLSEATLNETGIITAVTVKNIKNEVLGRAYIVKIVNGYSWHIMAVGLDLNNNLVKVVDVDNFHPGDGNKADITAHLETFEAGMTYEDVLNYKVDPEAHGTYTREQINLAIYIAMSESISDSKVKYEVAAKTIFNTMISTKSEIITKFNDSSITFGYKVTGLVNYNTNPYDPTQGLVGYAYAIKSGNLEIMVGITNDNKVKAIYCFGEKQNVDDFAGKTKEEVEALENSEIKTLVLKVFNELGGNK